MATNFELEDWQTSRTLAECNKYMLEHQLQCDVTFRVGTEGAIEDIKAHKYMLISRSPVFYTMFCGSLPQSDKSVIELPDVDPQAFKEMLKYLYYEDKNLNIAEHGLLIMYCAKKYMLPKLTEVCSKFLENNITVENVALILEQSLTMDEEELRVRCLNFICQNAAEVFSIGSHVGLSCEAWKLVVQSDELMVKESDVYNACIEWAKGKCTENGTEQNAQQLREVLGDLLYDIRIPTMTQCELANCLRQCDVFNHDELKHLFLYYSTGETDMLQFQAKPRHSASMAMHCYRFTEKPTGRDWNVNSSPDKLDIMCTSNVILHGIMVYGGTVRTSSHDVVVEVLAKNGVVVGEGSTTVVSAGQGEVHNVLLTKPCELSTNTKYTVSMAMTGTKKTWAGSTGKGTVAYEGGAISFTKSSGSNNGNGVENGQIPGVLLKHK